MSSDFKLGRVSVQFANAFAIAITFARWQRRSQESATVPYGANFCKKLLMLFYSLSLLQFVHSAFIVLGSIHDVLSPKYSDSSVKGLIWNTFAMSVNCTVSLNCFVSLVLYLIYRHRVF